MYIYKYLIKIPRYVDFDTVNMTEHSSNISYKGEINDYFNAIEIKLIGVAFHFDICTDTVMFCQSPP